MKVFVTRPNILANPSAPPRPLRLDTEALSPDAAQEILRLAQAAKAETAAQDSARRQEPAIELRIEDSDQTVTIEQPEGRLTPAYAALVDAVSRLQPGR